MSKYTQVDSLIWNSTKFLNLTIKAKALFFNYLTGTHNNSCGMFFIKDSYTKTDLPINSKDLDKYRTELIESEMIYFDKDRNIVLIKSQLKYSSFTNPNHAKGGYNQIKFMVDSPLYDLLRIEVQTYCAEYLQYFPERVSKGYRKGIEIVSKPYSRGVDTSGNGNGIVNGNGIRIDYGVINYKKLYINLTIDQENILVDTFGEEEYVKALDDLYSLYEVNTGDDKHLKPHFEKLKEICIANAKKEA